MAYLRILCGILPFVFFFSLFAFYLLVEDMGWLARLLCILCVLGTLGVCLAFQVWFYRIVQRRREEQRLALAQECVRQQSLRPQGVNYLSGKYGYLGTGIGLSSVQEVVNRNHSRVAKAPQGYRLDDVLNVEERAISEGYTNMIDTCTLMRHYGHDLSIVDCGADNVKITTPEDFFMFRAVADARENEQLM
jgi:hypothetical protein